jgi:hypothetical protein
MRGKRTEATARSIVGIYSAGGIVEASRDIRLKDALRVIVDNLTDTDAVIEESRREAKACGVRFGRRTGTRFVDKGVVYSYPNTKAPKHECEISFYPHPRRKDDPQASEDIVMLRIYVNGYEVSELALSHAMARALAVGILDSVNDPWDARKRYEDVRDGA